MASAALDRLLHRSTVIHIRGDTYRLKEKRHAKSQPLDGCATNHVKLPPFYMIGGTSTA